VASPLPVTKRPLTSVNRYASSLKAFVTGHHHFLCLRDVPRLVFLLSFLSSIERACQLKCGNTASLARVLPCRFCCGLDQSAQKQTLRALVRREYV
jgi:hypothetical protein